MNRLLPLALAVSATLAPAAGAAVTCTGGEALRLCYEVRQGVPSVDPDGGPTVSECVYIDSATCTPVSVTLPSVGLGPAGGVYLTCYRGEVRCW